MVTLSKSEKIIEQKKAKSRRLSILEGGAYSISEGFGLRNIAPYALALNASNSMIAFLTSISSLLGSVSQLITHSLLRKHTRKKIVSLTIFIQTLFWLLLLLPGLLFIFSKNHSTNSVILLIVLYTGLIVSGSIAGPAWNSWMKDLVPKERLGEYFSKRNKICGTVVFISMLIAGAVLDYFKKTQVLYGFFILIFFSFIFRGISAFIFTKMYEPKYKESKTSYFSLNQFLTNMPFNNFGRFVLFIALTNLVVAIAGPFFAVYLLKERGLSYIVYMSLTILMPVSTIATMTYWGKFSDKIGNVRIMRLTGVFIALIPFIYILSNSLPRGTLLLIILGLAEVIAGISWGGFNLSASNFIFKTVSREKMVLCTSYLNVLNGMGIFIGATLGGFLASLKFWNPILLVFLVSGIGRILVYFIVLPKIKESPHESSKYDKKDFISRPLIHPRYLHQMSDIVYFRRTFNNLKKSRLFNFV